MNTELMYLDHAAATPLDERVLEAMQPYFSEFFFNPSSPYAPAVKVRREYEDAKARLARWIGGRGDEVVITAGATESINLAFESVSGHVVTSSIEHHAVLAAAKKHEYTLVPPSPKGLVDVELLRGAIRSDTELVSIALANNELGTVQPLRDVAVIVHEVRRQRLESGNPHPIYLHTDASQGVGQLDVHVARLGVDMMTVNSGKIYGPKQVALLWAAAGVNLRPQIVGGGQERGLRSGTENVPGLMGFARALELATEHYKSESSRLRELRDSLELMLTNAFDFAIVSGHPKRRLPGHLHISFPGMDAERLLFALESRGVLVATGSACAANKNTRSHVLTAIGMDDQTADSSLRLTLGRLSSSENVRRAGEIIIEEIARELERTRR